MHKSTAASITPLLLLVHVALVSAQAPDPSVPPPPPPPPTTEPAAGPTVTADALLGFLQREATAGGSACALSTTYRVGERLAIACGASGVWIAQIHPNGVLSLVARQYFGATVLRLFEGGGRLWAELQGGAAVPIDPNAAATSPAALPPPPPGTTPQPGTTTTAPTTTAAPSAPTHNALPPAPGESPPWSGHVAPTAPVQRTVGMWEVAGTIRPFLALETLGGGVVIDAEAGYRFAAPVHVWASLQPFAPATGKDTGATSPFVALLLASYDTRNFELGLGFGGQSVNATSDDVDIDGVAVEPGSGITVAQFARLGQRDGLMMSIRSDIVLFHSEFELSNVFIHGQLPLRGEQAIWIIANGGGGTTGYALGEIGLRTRLRGDDTGGAGSVFLTVTVGGVSLFKSPVCVRPEEFRTHCSFDYSGPLLGIGSEWRL